MTPKKTIAIIGLGYVGLPLAVEFGKQRSTIGFDINARRVAELQDGQDHTLECSPEELAQAQYLHYSCDTQDLKDVQVFIVTVPTPVDQANRPDMAPLVKASETVGKVLKAGDIVIYESTVYPGATEEVCVPVLEKFSGFKFNQDFFAATAPSALTPATKNTVYPPSKKSPAAAPLPWQTRSMRFTPASSQLAPIKPAPSRWPKPPKSSRTPSATSTSRS